MLEGFEDQVRSGVCKDIALSFVRGVWFRFTVSRRAGEGTCTM